MGLTIYTGIELATIGRNGKETKRKRESHHLFLTKRQLEIQLTLSEEQLKVMTAPYHAANPRK